VTPPTTSLTNSLDGFFDGFATGITSVRVKEKPTKDSLDASKSILTHQKTQRISGWTPQGKCVARYLNNIQE
jgi:hypothetical protein